MEPLCLVDGSGILFRAFHALPPLTNRAGLPTGAVYGVTSMLVKLMRSRPDERVVVVFDAPGKNFRDEIYPEYKAGRAETPPDLKSQIPWVKKMVVALGLPLLEIPGVEADDVIGTLTRQAEAEGARVDIVTSDKDMMQLVGPRVHLLDTMKDRITDESGVREKFGVPPDRVIEVMGLMGDSVDNVPGVKGVGEKTAKRLIEHFGTIAELYRRIDEVDDLGLRGAARIKKQLLEGREAALTSRELVTIKCDVELGLGPDSLERKPVDGTELDSLARELEFAKLLEGFLSGGGARPASRRAVREVSAAEVGEALSAGGVSLALVLAEPAAGGGAPRTLASAAATLESGDVLVCEGLPDGLADVLTNAERGTLAVADLKAALHAAGPLTGVDVNGEVLDTSLLSYVLDPSRRGHGIDALCAERLEQTLPSEDDPTERASATAAAIADLAPTLWQECRTQELDGLYGELEIPVCRILAGMEERGIGVDVGVIETAGREFEATAAGLEAEIHELAGGPFKIGSTVQLRDVLFEKLGLPTKGVKRGKTGLSVNAEVLSSLADKHPLPAKVIEHRALSKLLSTYVTGLLPLVDPATGRLHTTFNQAVAATGRLSSSDPNLQNIPVRTAEGRRIREAFVPAPDHVFVTADYSQIELRVLAHLTGDPVLVAAFQQGEDIHRRTAAEVFEVPPEDVTSTMRSRAKVINFGILYGMGSHRLSRELGIPIGEADAYIKRYFERYGHVRAFADQVVEQGREDGFVRTLIGRRRYLPDLSSRDGGRRQAAERMAWNSPIQGTAADIIKLAMVAVDGDPAVEKAGAAMLLQVHDELLFEVPRESARELGEIVRNRMESVVDLAVPLVVDVASGGNWAALK